jgi:hypothetical protein
MDRLIKLTERQYGVFARWQAARLGFNRTDLRRLRRRGWIEPASPQVFRVMGTPKSYRQRLMIAVLDAGAGAVASFIAAACLHGLPGFGEAIEVSARRAGRRRPAPFGIRHRPLHLPRHHKTRKHGIPVTTIERTLFDLAGIIHWKRLERAIDTALNSGATTVERLWAVWTELATSERRAVVAMHKALRRLEPGYVPPESELESRFLDLLTAAGISLPIKQVNLGNQEQWIGRVDFWYAAERIVIEVHGSQHRSELEQRKDEARRLEFEAQGIRVMEFWWDQVVLEGDKVIAAVRGALARAAA